MAKWLMIKKKSAIDNQSHSLYNEATVQKMVRNVNLVNTRDHYVPENTWQGGERIIRRVPLTIRGWEPIIY